MINGELIVDNFAGGGGASTGIEEATGYCVDIAINHDPEAIKMHKGSQRTSLFAVWRGLPAAGQDWYVRA